MTTISQVCKAIVTDAIDHDYLLECGSLSNVYRSEYGYNGVSPKACEQYLRGLPSVCEIPFYDWQILELLEEAGITVGVEEDCIQGQYDLIEKYWQECGNQFYLLIK
jgi:hypothetical protein